MKWTFSKEEEIGQIAHLKKKIKSEHLSIIFQFEPGYIFFLSNQPIPNFCQSQDSPTNLVENWSLKSLPKWKSWAQANKP